MTTGTGAPVAIWPGAGSAPKSWARRRMGISALDLHCWRRHQTSLTTPLVRPARDILYCPMKVSETMFLSQSLSSSCAESGSATTNLKTSSHLGLRVEEATEVLC